MTNAPVLVDTNIVSYVFNQHALGLSYKQHLQGRVLIIAAQTVAELRYGAYRAQWGETRWQKLEAALQDYAVAYPDDETCRLWALIKAQGDRFGRRLDPGDAWIAATALALEVPLLTHNKKHFEFIPALVLVSEQA